ncbi:MAG: YfcC family protein, partial [Saprospiraceae bacterium]
ISVGAITVGFGLSPVNPYTVGTGHRIAELPLFSGSLYRSIICMTGLSLLAWYNIKYFKSITANITNGLSDGLDTHGFTLSKPLDEYKMSAKDKMVMMSFLVAVLVILYGAYELHWFINQISAIFCMLAIVIGLINKNNGQQFGEIILKSVAVVAPGAFMVGMATSIKVALDMGNISDTIAYTLSSALMGLPVFVSAMGMAVAQTCMNFIIPSGSGQALATLPVMIPVGEVIGMTRQSTVLAFQIGDGVSNLINPSLGGLVAMLAMCRVPFDRWLRFIFPFFIMILVLALVFLACSIPLKYGPF